MVCGLVVCLLIRVAGPPGVGCIAWAADVNFRSLDVIEPDLIDDSCWAVGYRVEPRGVLASVSNLIGCIGAYPFLIALPSSSATLNIFCVQIDSVIESEFESISSVTSSEIEDPVA
ncbi:hypothetical protein TNCV_327771 [Trichonephila clavipes]|nr:hypothetical protein TNCV_327771 [Trichonephila clavipes]